MRIARLAIVAMVIVILVYVAAMVLLASDCKAGNCTSYKWQQTTVIDCKCWYKGADCDGRCTRSGMWDGDRLTCTCPEISTCGNNVTMDPLPTPTLPSLPAAEPGSGTGVIVIPAPTAAFIPLPTLKKCVWYPGIAPGKEMYIGEVRKDWTSGITWKCLPDGRTIKVGSEPLATEELVTERKRWPGGFMGCRNTYGSGWHLSKGQCVKTMKICTYPGVAGMVEQRAVISARSSCEDLFK